MVAVGESAGCAGEGGGGGAGRRGRRGCKRHPVARGIDRSRSVAQVCLALLGCAGCLLAGAARHNSCCRPRRAAPLRVAARRMQLRRKRRFTNKKKRKSQQKDLPFVSIIAPSFTVVGLYAILADPWFLI